MLQQQQRARGEKFCEAMRMSRNYDLRSRDVNCSQRESVPSIETGALSSR
jgi:hypothetical protein